MYIYDSDVRDSAYLSNQSFLCYGISAGPYDIALDKFVCILSGNGAKNQ